MIGRPKEAEGEINEQINLWEDKDFQKEIDMRLDEYESGNIKTSTWEEVRPSGIIYRTG